MLIDRSHGNVYFQIGIKGKMYILISMYQSVQILNKSFDVLHNNANCLSQNAYGNIYLINYFNSLGGAGQGYYYVQRL